MLRQLPFSPSFLHSRHARPVPWPAGTSHEPIESYDIKHISQLQASSASSGLVSTQAAHMSS
eukprot:9645-Eustigmatos_ZCMA.PRE.1